MSLSHSADTVVFYLAKLKTWLKPACPATGTSLNREISRLTRLARANNEGADQTAPMRGCFALCYSHPTTSRFLVCRLIFLYMLPRSKSLRHYDRLYNT